MANNVIGVFISIVVAEQVMNDLTSSGFNRSSITRYEGGSDDLEGQLRRSGISADDASDYAAEVGPEGVIVVVLAEDARIHEAVEIMNRYGLEGQGGDNGDAAANYRKSGDLNLNGTDTDEARFEVVEERLLVGKREVNRGGVRVRRVVSETPVEEQVTLRDETVHIERQPVDRTVSGTDDLFTEKSLELTETDEEAVVTKQAHVNEEVVVSKEVEYRTETIRDTVRRVDIEIEELGTAYGESLANDARYAGREWHEVEADARAGWERDNRDTGSWEEAKGPIRRAWERILGKR